MWVFEKEKFVQCLNLWLDKKQDEGLHKPENREHVVGAFLEFIESEEAEKLRM